MLALGGWSFGSQPFQDLTSNQYRMNGFVYDSLEFLRTHEFDGLDIDWEVRHSKTELKKDSIVLWNGSNEREKRDCLDCDKTLVGFHYHDYSYFAH